MRYACVYTFTAPHKNSVNALAFSHNGHFLASGDDDGVLAIFNTRNGSQCSKTTFPSAITSLMWSLDGTIIFIGLADGSIHQFLLAEFVGFRLAMNSNAQIQSIALHNRKIAIAAGDTVGLFDLEPHRSKVATWTQSSSVGAEWSSPQRSSSIPEVRSIDFFKSGQSLLITYLEHGIRCWNVDSHCQEWQIKPHSFRIGRSAINASETYLVCSNLFDGFDVYCLNTQQYLRTLPAHNVENVSLSLSFVHADVEAVLGTSNGAVKVVNILDGNMTADLHHDSWDMIQTVAYEVAAETTPQQHIIATASSEKGPSTYVKLWVAEAGGGPNDDEDGIKVETSPDDNAVNHDQLQQTMAISLKGNSAAPSAANRYRYCPRSWCHTVLIILFPLSLLVVGLIRVSTSVNPIPAKAQHIQRLAENWHLLCQWFQHTITAIRFTIS